MLYQFEFDERLGIAIPDLKKDWNSYDKETQEEILTKWEEIRGDIPDRVKHLEGKINRKQDELYNEDDFDRSCTLNSEISDLASAINDLWLWFRAQGEITGRSHF
ncbi:hypothetical protein DS745_19710 [Anaerobacillus alkaliphilus]|uniref:Radical SAM protein n=1 Tax=Anaerobacillus alkaliphilus TaxID=1548597 RepID=A0A4Q0VQN0_9BACI|nr:hypothetical protein [Anaerobacillus alkaliphilus]RXI98753.1 hypothetical protein DS745_19710 [Anaerobacillus alkaliphilus]